MINENCIQMILLVKNRKMPAAELAEGVKRIIMSTWPHCDVDLSDMKVLSVSSLDFVKQGTDSEE